MDKREAVQAMMDGKKVRIKGNSDYFFITEYFRIHRKYEAKPAMEYDIFNSVGTGHRWEVCPELRKKDMYAPSGVTLNGKPLFEKL